MDTIEKALNKFKQAQPDEAEADQVSEQSPAGQDHVADLPRVVSDAEQRPKSSELGAARRHLEFDLEHLNKVGIIVPDQKRSKIKEEYKHIKQPLLQRANQDSLNASKSNIIMITSAYSGEGKTFSALNLALSIAVERDKRVLLVDTDVVKPGLAKLLNMENNEGLVEYLNGDIPRLSDVLMTTNVNNLSVLLAGKTHHLSHELLASNAMHQLVKEMSSRYSDRIVIFDSPPLLMTSEAKILSQLVGQIVLVVEQDRTAQASVEDALAVVDRSKVTGLILNKSSLSGGYYGYYYGDYQT